MINKEYIRSIQDEALRIGKELGRQEEHRHLKEVWQEEKRILKENKDLQELNKNQYIRIKELKKCLKDGTEVKT
jgi:hypothetical protein